MSNAQLIQNEYKLCNSCLRRLFPNKFGSSLVIEPTTQCYICRNLMSDLPMYIKKIQGTSSDFEFSSFLVGAIVKHSILDRDDQIRSKFRLKGRDSVKTGITKELGRQLSRKTNTKVDYISPDVTITINFKKDECEIKSKPILLSGNYTKTRRGIPQKQPLCVNCRGKGCNSCQFHGIPSFDSIEGKIAKLLYQKFDSMRVKLTWIGGEDSTSLVLGKGRPFFVKILNPKRREVRLTKKILQDGITVNNLKIVEKIPTKVVRFSSKVKLLISTQNEIETQKLRKLGKLEKKPITIYENAKKENKKWIYDIKYKKSSSHSFTLTMKADGGLPLKRFVEGKNVIPNISDTVNNNCKCELFDFDNIKIIT